MELKPEKGIRVKVRPTKEAVFGEEEVTVNDVGFPKDASRDGILTGNTLAGYCEVEMLALDGKRHWYPIDEITGENGEKLVEESVEAETDEDSEE
jgi:hypothetical protein